MEMEMGPPALPTYSLRVQLFAYSSNVATDRPIRLFRVISSPHVTLAEFCEEASRIHEINYGQPISIRRCMDAEGYDVSLFNIVGHIFPNLATIRMEQDTSLPNPRDSVPPTSALRFDHSKNNRKRRRETSIGINGSGPSEAPSANKRRRVTDVDPDHPLPSSEHDLGGIETVQVDSVRWGALIVPNSQQSAFTDGEQNGTPRDVRDEGRRIPETPSPSPPPELQRATSPENDSADHTRKSALENLQEEIDPLPSSQKSLVSPFKATPKNSILPPNGSRSKSASYHIERATERGISISTAATSPLSGDHLPNGQRSASKRKASNIGPKSTPIPASRPANGESIYDDFGSESEETATLKRPKSLLKIKSSSPAGLPGLNWSKKVNTPSNGSRRSSQSSALGELPLTPSSKERQEKQRQNKEAEVARNTQVAAAEAAEQRKREAEEARQVEESRIAKEEKLRREEQERFQAQEMERKELEKQAAVIAKNERIRKENQKKEDERRIEEQRKADEKQREEDRKLKVATERVERERAEAEENQRSRKEREEEERVSKAAATEKSRKEAEASKKRSISRSVEPSDAQKASSPDLPRRSTSAIRPPQSSTPHIPSGRKSSLKRSVSSSQAPRSSSPSRSAASPEVSSNGVGLEAQMPLLRERRVSFLELGPQLLAASQTPSKDAGNNVEHSKAEVGNNTPAKTTASKIVPPFKKSTPILPPSKNSSPIIPTSSQNIPSSQNIEKKTFVSALREQHSHSPIIPPSKKFRKEGSAIPIKQSTIVPQPSNTLATSAPKTIPQTRIPSKSPGPMASTAKSPALERISVAKEKLKSAEASPYPVRQPEVEISSDESESESDSEEDSSAKALNKPTTTSNSPSRTSPTIKQEPDVENIEEEAVEISEMEDVELASAHSTRESRSPVVFQKHINSDEPGESPNLTKSRHLDTPEPQSSDESEANVESDGGEESVPENDEDGESEEEPTHPQSSQQLPPLRVNDKAAAQKETNDSKPLSDDGSSATQDEVDLQLTSDMFEVEKAPATIASAVRPSPILLPPISKTIRPPIRPSFRIGASLSSFNNRANGNGARAANGPVNPTKQPFKAIQSDEEGSAEEYESADSDDESSSESEKEVPPKQVWNSSQKSISKPAVESTSSDSDSDSESESALSDSEGDTTRYRNELTAKLIKSANGDESNSENDTTIARKAFTVKVQKSKNVNSHLPSSQGSAAASQKVILSSSQNGRKDGDEKKRKGDRIAGKELKKKKNDLVFGYKFAPYK